jgi:TRAP-type mannitol/chloroaromatic compound transport system substrate-binding protein
MSIPHLDYSFLTFAVDVRRTENSFSKVGENQMKPRLLTRVVGALSLTVAAAAVLGLTAAPAAALDKVRWRVPIAFPSTLPALGDAAPWVAERLDAASDGTVRFKIEEPGKIVPAFQIMEAVKDNKVKAGYTWVGYDQGKIPATPLLAAVPFGLEPVEYNAWWYFADGKELGAELYAPQNIHPILCGIISPETAGWFRTEITSLDDIKGLKIRFAGLGGKVMQKLGASVTVLPGGEIYQALEKGALDATEFSLPEVDQRLGFHQIAKNNYFPGWHQQFTASHLLVNKGEWEKLSASTQSFIEMGCMAAVTYSLAKSERNQGPVIAGFPEKGVTPRVLPEPILRELQAVTNEVLAEEAAKDEMFKKIYESQQAFRAEYANWKQLGYLPRDF